MLQYLLNATAIWLISLLLFDVFLSKESYHSYNRFYLLFTFMLGALLPLLQWQEEGKVYTATFEKPLQQVIYAKQAIIAAPAAAPTSINWQQWLTFIYLSGALAALCLLVIDIIKMLAFYQNGKKSEQDHWTLIETSKEHAPFSFLNTLFVCNKAQYNPEEWNMILAHEKRHTSLLHFTDLLLMQAARIIFWFHPLVYVYNKRLLLVHEYQADSASAREPQAYGAFLIEQALLKNAPSISHSFNCSPIKNRVVMLTKTSTKAAKTKTLIFIPLLVVCLLCFSKNIFSQKAHGNQSSMIVFGNTIADNDKWRAHNVTYDQLLANTGIICKEPGCVVTGFTISFLPKGKDFFGPFRIAGTKIQKKQLDFIQELKNSRNPDTRMYIEKITVRSIGAEDTLRQGIAFLCTLK